MVRVVVTVLPGVTTHSVRAAISLTRRTRLVESRSPL